MDSISNRIAACVQSKLKSFNKPTKGWTVLAGFVAVTKAEGQPARFDCISVGTGLKCLAPSKADAMGRLVKDSHAEVIAHRNLKRFFMQEMLSCRSGQCSDYILASDSTFRLKDHVEIALYISQSPCGDASMGYIEQLQSNAERVGNLEKKRKYDELCEPDARETVIRGRHDYSSLGRLRTKPGRIDAESTTSMSCSDKVAKWIALGLGGAFVSYFFKAPVPLTYICVGEGYDQGSLERALLARTSDWRAQHHPQLLVQIGPVTTPFASSKQLAGAANSDAAKSDVSVSWSLRDKAEVLVNGRKQGAVLPKTQTVWPLKTCSRVCKRQLMELFLQLLPLESRLSCENYRQLKLLAADYQSRKALLFKDPFGGWIFYDAGLSYHALIYLIPAGFYLLLGIIWGIHAKRSYAIMRGLPLFSALSIILATMLFEKIITAVSIIVIELRLGPFPNLSLFAANLLFLWNISYLYMLMMMIASGWCVTKVTIAQSEKQIIVLVGSGMMLVEVLLVGDIQNYSMVLLFGYILVFRVFYNQIAIALNYLKLQAQCLEELGTNYSVVKASLKKKSELLKSVVVCFFVFLVSRMAVNVAKLYCQLFYATSAEQICEIVLMYYLLFLFRLRKPDEVHLVVLANGQLGIPSREPPVAPPKNSIQLDAIKTTKMAEHYVIIQPCRPNRPIVDFAFMEKQLTH
ncbi:hypothetical protein HDV03_003905 [Kappamyces sp. JEL0829]|nr:hypothetical protein HDV03_003905 [Kappamyces sp. JEL0829]